MPAGGICALSLPHCCRDLTLQDRAAVAAQRSTGWVPRVGQTVLVPRLGKRAKVLAVDATGGTLTLQVGLLKVAASCDEVRQQ